MNKKSKFANLKLENIKVMSREDQAKIKGGYNVCYDRLTGGMYFSSDPVGCPH